VRSWGGKGGSRGRSRREWGEGGETTQTLYAHMNIIKKEENSHSNKGKRTKQTKTCRISSCFQNDEKSPKSNLKETTE
jgi:hypothetical protein